MELRHLADTKVNKFQVSFRISGQGILNVIGKYERVNPYTDLELQRKLFRTLNAFPGSKWIREFVLDKTSTNISITVDDQELPHPINFTRIQIEKILELS